MTSVAKAARPRKTEPSPEPAPAVDLDEFTEAYVECALWSSIDDDGTPLDRDKGTDDINLETLREMIADCRDFQESFGELIERDLPRAGHDFWLTRNGHGAGFWDGDWPKKLPKGWRVTWGAKTVGDYLTAMSHPYGEVNLYVGDDGKVYA